MQNVNGIPVQDIEDEFHHMLNLMTIQDINICGWSETNIEWNDHRIYQKLYQIMKRHYQGGTWQPSTSNIAMKSTYKPGGNLMILNKNINSRTNSFQKDEMGRWVWTEIRGQQKPVVVIQ